MNETVDGDYQTFKSKDGAYVREHFFGKYPETAATVADWTDEQIWALNRGGHDPKKVYAALKKAQETKGQPTVIPRIPLKVMVWAIPLKVRTSRTRLRK